MTNDELRACMKRLHLASDDIQFIQASRSRGEAGERLRALQERVRRRFKKVAPELHPDHNPDDPEKEEEFKRLLEVVEWVKGLKVAPPPPPRPVVPVIPMGGFFVGGGGFYGGGTYSNTSSTTTGWGPAGPSVVFTIKV